MSGAESAPSEGKPPGRLRLLACLLGPVVQRGTGGGRAGFSLREWIHRPAMWAKWELSGVSGARIPSFSTRFGLLAYAEQQASPEGLRLEFGVFDGTSLSFLAARGPSAWFGFDSFEGLPGDWSVGFRRGSFSRGGNAPRMPENVTLVQGRFEDTLPEFQRSHPGGSISFLHVDCDLYSSARTVLFGLSGAIVKGTIIVFDEFTGLLPDDEARAFHEWARAARRGYGFLGVSLDGSVALRIER